MHIGRKIQLKAVLSLTVVITTAVGLLGYVLHISLQTGSTAIIIIILLISLILAFMVSLLFYYFYSRPLIKFWCRAEQHARVQTRKQFADFMDDLPLGVFIKDDKSKAVYLNKYMDTVFGKSNCMGKSPYNIYDRTTADRVMSEDKRVLAGENVMIEESLTDKNGRNRVYMTHKFLMQEEDSDPLIGGISIEITRRREAEYKLRILSKAIRNSPVCVIITDPGGMIEYVNPAFVNSTGYSFAEVMGENTRIINSGRHEKQFFSDMWSVIKQGQDWQGEILNKKKDGSLFWELVNISSVKNNVGEITHFVAIKDNISKRKHMEEELLRAKEKAEDSDRLKSAFLANMSHEIRTPMNAIVGLSSLLSDPELPLSERAGFSSIIQENSNVLLQLIDDIVDVSKIEAGQIKIRPAVCEINALLTEIHESYTLQIRNKGDKVKLLLNKSLNGQKQYTITDSYRLRQVLTNLISNALKFTDQGTVEFGYSIKNENEIQFFVKDTGIGIPADKHDLIFDRFRQADDTSTRYHQGAGLGLSISKSLVELLGGRIWVESARGHGSSFYFTIPMRKSSDKKGTEAQNPELLSIPDLTGKTILVVEDLEVNYTLLEALLKKTGANLPWAENGINALEYFKNNNDISLVLLDLNLPDIHGLDVLMEIKKKHKDLPVIIHTAYAMNGEKEVCLKAGCDGFITKPINLENLVRTIKDCNI
jgi:PAS domain S-box-containing protein